MTILDLPEELKAKTVQIIWDHDLDAYIEAKLGRKWSLQQNGEDGQETLTYFEVFPDPEATAKVQAWLDSPEVPCPGRVNGMNWETGIFTPEQPGFAEWVYISTTDILNELCNRGLLPEGDYTVHVWW